jgi:hypothetical protein
LIPFGTIAGFSSIKLSHILIRFDEWVTNNSLACPSSFVSFVASGTFTCKAVHFQISCGIHDQLLLPTFAPLREDEWMLAPSSPSSRSVRVRLLSLDFFRRSRSAFWNFSSEVIQIIASASDKEEVYFSKKTAFATHKNTIGQPTSLILVP